MMTNLSKQQMETAKGQPKQVKQFVHREKSSFKHMYTCQLSQVAKNCLNVLKQLSTDK